MVFALVLVSVGGVLSEEDRPAAGTSLAFVAAVEAKAVGWADDAFPGFVEVLITDAEGEKHRVIEKPPVIGDDRLTRDAAYPMSVTLPCDVTKEALDGTLHVALRHGIESVDGKTHFRVASASVSDE